MVPVCFYSNPVLMDAMGALWHQTSLEICFRQHTLESSLFSYQHSCGFYGGNSRLWQGGSQQRHVSSLLCSFQCEFQLLFIVTGDLLAKTECLNVSSKERLPGQHLQESCFPWKYKEERKQFQKSLSPV